MKLAVSHIVECVQGCIPMRHAQPRPSMTRKKLFLVDATFGLGVKTSRTVCVRLKLHGPCSQIENSCTPGLGVKVQETLASEGNFSDPWSRCETSGIPGLKVKIHEPLVSE
jgi:hypothetical protein